MLAEKMKKLGEDLTPLLMLPMYLQLSANLQAKIFEAVPKGVRKCIVSIKCIGDESYRGWNQIWCVIRLMFD